MPDALISIKQKYVDKFLNGQKAVEIRNRKVNLSDNSKLWIYTTLPKASIQTIAYVKHVDTDAPELIWKKYWELIGISKISFNQYVNGSNKISAIVTKDIQELPIQISLEEIRDIVPGFQPPQFLKFMSDDDPILLAIHTIISRESR